MQHLIASPKLGEKPYSCEAEFFLGDVGKVTLIRRALYGGKVIGRDFWYHLQSCMNDLAFKPSKAGSDVWFRLSKQANGDEYYEHVLLYVDDCLVISDRANSPLREEIDQHFVLKKESILRRVKLGNGIDA